MKKKLSKYFNLADQIGLVSSELLRYRIKKRPELTEEQVKKLEDIEKKLDQATTKIRNLGVAALVGLDKISRDHVLLSTLASKLILRKIKKVDYAVLIGSSVLALALAAIQKKPDGVVSAAKSLKQLVDEKLA